MLTCNFITFAEAVRTMPENIPPPGIYFDLVCKINKIIILLDSKARSSQTSEIKLK